MDEAAAGPEKDPVNTAAGTVEAAWEKSAHSAAEELDHSTFEKIRDFVGGKCGISLCDKKKPLVSARIRKRMRALQIKNPGDYFRYIMDEPTGMEIVMLIDSISTNVTSFFRESAHLDFLGAKTSEWAGAGQSRFRFWSAACSSGEEPYSMAFVVKDALAGLPVKADVRILATDISTKVLGLAHQGMYESQRIKAVPEKFIGKYFDGLKGSGGNAYMVKQEVKDMLLIKRLNLTEMPFPMKGPMDAIFCRNVMIYFEKQLRKKLVDEFYRLLKPGGYLIVGHTESLVDIHGNFTRVGPSIYVK